MNVAHSPSPPRAVPWVCALLLLCVAASGRAADDAPIVVEHACPFECCQFGSWTTPVATPVYEAPDAGAGELARLAPGDLIEAITGETHTLPGRFVFDFDHDGFARGDVVELNGYLGEGSFRARHAGRSIELDLGFSPYGPQSMEPCGDPSRCSGHLERAMQMTWWVKIRMPDERIGWIRDPKGFAGSDACG